MISGLTRNHVRGSDFIDRTPHQETKPRKEDMGGWLPIYGSRRPALGVKTLCFSTQRYSSPNPSSK
jgi:hypothetical protein